MLVVHAAVATGDGLQLVVEVHEDLIEWQDGVEQHAAVIKGFGVVHLTALVHDELHHVADVLVRDHDVHFHDGLADLGDLLGSREEGGIIHQHLGAVRFPHLIDDGRIGGDDIHVKLTAQTLLNDLHVQKAEEAAAETKAERGGTLRHECEGGVVDLKLAHGELQGLEVIRADGVNAAENEGMDFVETWQRLGRGLPGLGQRVSDLHIGRGLHVGDDVADIASLQLLAGHHFRAESSEVFDFRVIA